MKFETIDSKCSPKKRIFKSNSNRLHLLVANKNHWLHHVSGFHANVGGTSADLKTRCIKCFKNTHEKHEPTRCWITHKTQRRKITFKFGTKLRFFFFKQKKNPHNFFFFTATQISFSKLAVLFYFCVCLVSFTLRWSSAVKSPIFSDWTFLTGFCGGETFLPDGENPDPNETKELVLSSSSPFLFFPADENFRMRRRNCFPSGMWIFIGGFREFQQVFPPKKNSFLKPRRIWIPKKKKEEKTDWFISVALCLGFFYSPFFCLFLQKRCQRRARPKQAGCHCTDTKTGTSEDDALWTLLHLQWTLPKKMTRTYVL